MDISLKGRVALVTGASKGIGLAIAKSLAESGAKVMLSSRKEDQLRAAAAGIKGETEVFAANAGDLSAASGCIDATLERFGAIDILVNNAATNPYFGKTLGVDEGRFAKTFDVNLKGPLFWTQMVHERWMKDHPGVIVIIASVGGMRAEMGLGVYNLTKAALIHMTRQLAAELGPTRVVGIAPGLVKTPLASRITSSEPALKASTAMHPLGRVGEPEDIVDVIVFLASEQARDITGQVIVADGGLAICPQ